ncbi:hypothetical protein IJ162_00080 [Candidatus Saccharibacteria bacterium]|nr:hypothetical protein [Candidatus Saccharibacteria bacterium]
MACIGTLQWAIDETERIRKRFDSWVDRAEAHDVTVRREVGHENLSNLLSQLDEPIRVLSCINDDFNRPQYDAALDLSKRISDAM